MGDYVNIVIIANYVLSVDELLLAKAIGDADISLFV